MMNVTGPLREAYTRSADVMLELDRLHRVWAAHRPSPPLKRGDLMLLGLLHEAEAAGQPPPTPSRLAARLKMSLPGISQKLRVLEENGYIRRTGEAADRRVTYVALTGRGRQASEDAMRHLLGSLEAALRRMGDDDVQALIRLLAKLNGAMQENLDSPPPQDTKE